MGRQLKLLGVDIITAGCLLFNTANLLEYSWLEIKNKNITVLYSETAFIRNGRREVYFLA